MKTNNKLKILQFINSHSNWRELLTKEPYNIMIRDDGEYTLLKYNQLFCDFNEQIVREARGLIIKKEGKRYIPVCIPYTKFFCLGDPNARRDIRKLAHRKYWHIQEKIDGSLIKLWFDNGKWHVSTNGTIDANKAPLQFPINNIKTYYDEFMYAAKDKVDFSLLDKQYTYMFELVGLENKVIVPYDKENIYYLGRRNNLTLLETPYEEDKCIGITCLRPKQLKVFIGDVPKKKAFNELIYMTNKLTTNDTNFEGFVVSDKHLKTRIKTKSLEYMKLFKMKGNGIYSPKKILLMILDSKDDDVLSFFPEYTPAFNRIKHLLFTWLNGIREDLRYMSTNTWEDRKSFAEWAKNSTYSPILFRAYGNSSVNEEWLQNEIKNISIDNLIKFIGADNV